MKKYAAVSLLLICVLVLLGCKTKVKINDPIKAPAAFAFIKKPRSPLTSGSLSGERWDGPFDMVLWLDNRGKGNLLTRA